jgi:hypothetical protein
MSIVEWKRRREYAFLNEPVYTDLSAFYPAVSSRLEDLE